MNQDFKVPDTFNPEILIWARLGEGFSREEAAEKLGVAHLELFHYETGNGLPPWSFIEKCAQVYRRQSAVFLLPRPPKDERIYGLNDNVAIIPNLQANAAESINILIAYCKNNIDGFDASLISDGYHTFGELYEHRIWLFIALCKLMDDRYRIGERMHPQLKVWRSKQYTEGGMDEGYFLLGMGIEPSEQIRYLLPIFTLWEATVFAETMEYAPAYDGHTSEDIFERLKNL